MAQTNDCKVEQRKIHSIDYILILKVLTVNTETKKIILTTKKTILSSTYHKLTEYDQARSGMVLEGVVTKVVEKGLRVLFYNGVKVSRIRASVSLLRCMME